MADQDIVKIETGLMDPTALQEKVTAMEAGRKILTAFIARNLVEGVDYGRIHIANRQKCQEPWNCTYQRRPAHWSKQSLFKAGSEKFNAMFQVQMIFSRDDETWEMAGRTTGLFCYKCELRSASGAVIAEGRGACSIQERNDPNAAIKMAQKRAQIDATLRCGALSDFFTQDIEDMVEEPKVQTFTENGNPKGGISQPQLSKIHAMLAEQGIDREQFEAWVEKTYDSRISGLGTREASAVIEALQQRAHSHEAMEVDTEGRYPQGEPAPQKKTQQQFFDEIMRTPAEQIEPLVGEINASALPDVTKQSLVGMAVAKLQLNKPLA